MIKTPLLSIVTTTKNDQYHENQLQRLKFIISYFIYSLKKMNALNKVEFIIVDWGSKEPLSNYFYEEVSKYSAIKFINVPAEESAKCELNFDVSEALNIGMKNSLGEHVMFASSDQFFPLSVFNNLLNILEKPEIYGIKGNEYKLVPRKFLEDDFLINETNMEVADQYLQSLNHSAMSNYDFPLNGGGAAGGNLLKKKQWIEIGGIKNTKKHNRGQDLVNLHETSKICSHIDTSTFGSFLLKLPRSKAGIRQTVVNEVKNPLDNLTFGYQSVINLNNIEIINNLNPPKKKIDFNKQLVSEKKNTITIKEVIGTLIDCISLSNIYSISLKSQDIQFILKTKIIIKTNELKNIILDEKQAIRFITYLAKSIPDLKFIILMDPKKNSSLDILKFRTAITHHIYDQKSGYYGHIKVVNFEQDSLKLVNDLKKLCIIKDFSEDNLTYFKNEFSSSKINATRIFINNSKTVSYNIKGNFVFSEKKQNLLLSDSFLNFLIYTLKTLSIVRKFLGVLKIKMKLQKVS
jgi:hypothetical protein